MKAIILLSGGIDSTVCLAKALSEGKECIGLTFDYGQRHHVELEHARLIANYYSIRQIELKLPSWGAEKSSSLMTHKTVPTGRTVLEIAAAGVAPTYVPARNTLFLAYALAIAEVENADEIHIGSNADDSIPYPDCRPSFFAAFQEVARYATKQAIESKPPRIVTPLSDLTKCEVITFGKKINAPLEITFSCYAPTPTGTPCGLCDACMLSKSKH